MNPALDTSKKNKFNRKNTEKTINKFFEKELFIQ
jgi:hypothetical protein